MTQPEDKSEVGNPETRPRDAAADFHRFDKPVEFTEGTTHSVVDREPARETVDLGELVAKLRALTPEQSDEAMAALMDAQRKALTASVRQTITAAADDKLDTEDLPGDLSDDAIWADGEKPTAESVLFDLIEAYLILNPQPSDDQVHSLADALGVTVDALEEAMYATLGAILGDDTDDEVHEAAGLDDIPDADAPTDQPTE